MSWFLAAHLSSRPSCFFFRSQIKSVFKIKLHMFLILLYCWRKSRFFCFESLAFYLLTDLSNKRCHLLACGLALPTYFGRNKLTKKSQWYSFHIALWQHVFYVQLYLFYVTILYSHRLWSSTCFFQYIKYGNPDIQPGY